MSEHTIYPSLDGRAVFITGGASGIGAALVRAFVLQGCRVGFVDLERAAGEALAAELAATAVVQPWFAAVDVTNTAELQEAIANAASALGPIACFVNNAATDMRHSPAEVTPASWREGMALNLDAAFFGAQAAAAQMRGNDGGSIINFGSINSKLAPTNMPGYVTAKAGIEGLTKALARDYGEFDIRVNAILPGWVVTERQLSDWLTPEAEKAWMDQVALKRRLMPEDVARLALFLAADDSNMITGQSFTIDGGRT